MMRRTGFSHLDEYTRCLTVKWFEHHRRIFAHSGCTTVGSSCCWSCDRLQFHTSTAASVVFCVETSLTLSFLFRRKSVLPNHPSKKPWRRFSPFSETLLIGAADRPSGQDMFSNMAAAEAKITLCLLGCKRMHESLCFPQIAVSKEVFWQSSKP